MAGRGPGYYAQVIDQPGTESARSVTSSIVPVLG